jgi:hypothetical protein
VRAREKAREKGRVRAREKDRAKGRVRAREKGRVKGRVKDRAKGRDRDRRKGKGRATRETGPEKAEQTVRGGSVQGGASILDCRRGRGERCGSHRGNVTPLSMAG